MKLKDMPEVQYIPANSYEEQRKNRLDDAVADYLNDADCSASDMYTDLIDVITEWEKYHQEYYQKAEQLKNLVRGIQQPNTSKRHSRLDSLD